MLEIPESYTISRQAEAALTGRTVTKLYPAVKEHKFAWFSAPFDTYEALFTGAGILSAGGHGMFADLFFSGGRVITINDGANLRLYPSGAELPKNYQMLMQLDDCSHLAFTVAMYGGIWGYTGELDNKYHKNSLNSPSPLTGTFSEVYFEKILSAAPDKISAKALLATEQRIPGLGNGVLQDVLFNAGVHPKLKINNLSSERMKKLFRSVKTTLHEMASSGGRDTEKDLFGEAGGYKTILSKNTYKFPCIRCGGKIAKEAYMGGSVYYCPVCQPL